MTVTTLADVEAALVRSLTADELAHVDRIIGQVEGDVLLRLPGYDLGPASAETITLDGAYGDTLTLPKYPVTAVASVSQYGATVLATGYTWTEKGYLRRLSWDLWPSANGPTSTSWGGPAIPVTVTYTHGQGIGGSPLVALVAEVVAARLTGAGRQGVRSMSIDTYSESYESAPDRSIGGFDPRRLAPYRRRAIGSVPLVGA